MKEQLRRLWRAALLYDPGLGHWQKANSQPDHPNRVRT
jgi:hypothetical protein